MSFRNERNSLDGMHTAILESGGANASAVEEGAFIARNILQQLSLEQLERLTPEQRDYRESLLQQYTALPDEVSGLRWRRRWFEAARELLLPLLD